MPPDQPASDITFSEVTGQSMTVTFEPGNGQKRVVLMAEENLQVNPVTIFDGTELTGNTDFSLATEYQTGWKVVYAGDQSFVNINGLNSNINYVVTVIEYNGSATETRYLNENAPVATQMTLPGTLAPTVPASDINFIYVTSNFMNITFTKGNGAKRIVVMKQGSAPDFVPEDDIQYSGELSNGNLIVYDGSGEYFPLHNLTGDALYYFTIYEYNTNESGTDISYLIEGAPVASQRTLPEVVTPTVQASNVTFSNVTPTSMTVSFTSGNGGYRLAVMRTDFVIDFWPYDNIIYEGEQNNGTVVVYNGSGNSFDLTNLQPNSLYVVKVYEYNTNGQETKYLTIDAPATAQMTKAMTDARVITPVDGAFDQNVNNLIVTALKIAKAKTYTIELSPFQDFSADVITKSGSRTQTFSGLMYNTLYFARVKTNLSPYYGVSTTFNTAPAHNFAYVISPVNKATGVGTSVTVKANPLNYATSYTIELNTSSSFDGNSLVQSANVPEILFTGLSTKTTYYTRVLTDLSMDVWGKTTSFTTGSKKTSTSRTNGEETIGEEADIVFNVNIRENPFKQQLTFTVTSPSEEDAVIKLSDLTGKLLVHSFEKTNQSVTIDKPLQQGIYLLHVHTQAGSKVVRVVKIDQ